MHPSWQRLSTYFLGGGLLDPRNVEKGTPSLVVELGTLMGMDGLKLWNEFLAYCSLASSLTHQSLQKALMVMWSEGDRQTSLLPSGNEISIVH